MESHTLEVPVEEEFRTTKKTGKQWPTGKFSLDSKNLIVNNFDGLTAPCSLEQIVVVTSNGKLRAYVHRIAPKHLVHITKGGERLYIFCRQKPLLLTLMSLRKQSVCLYSLLSEFFRKNARDVVWPVTVSPPRRELPAQRLRMHFDCDRCEQEATVVNWRDIYLCATCYEGLPVDGEEAGWKWEEL